jgi:hypothetical protein
MTDFGTDTSCTNGLHSGRLVIGPRLVAEACYRRLTTARGMLRGGEDEQNYGLDLMDLVGSIASRAQAAALPGQIQAELLKDERLVSVDVDVVSTVSGPSTSYAVSILGHTDDGPFTLVLGVSNVSVDLLGIQET